MAIRSRSRDGVSSTLIHKRETNGRPRAYGSGWLPSPATFPPSKPLSFPETTVQGLFSRAASGIFDSVTDIALNLPPHLLLSLVYRVVVLHFAARIIPAIRKNSMGYDDGMTDETRPGSFWDGRSLGEEPMVSHRHQLCVRKTDLAEYETDYGSACLQARNPHRGLHTFASYVATSSTSSDLPCSTRCGLPNMVEMGKHHHLPSNLVFRTITRSR